MADSKPKHSKNAESEKKKTKPEGEKKKHTDGDKHAVKKDHAKPPKKVTDDDDDPVKALVNKIDKIGQLVKEKETTKNNQAANKKSVDNIALKMLVNKVDKILGLVNEKKTNQ